MGCKTKDFKNEYRIKGKCVSLKRKVVRAFTSIILKQKHNQTLGTLEENGVGKFNDFTSKALQEIKIWV
jgi:ABC-type microcin C transport system duplicated ATPase subunit YejF